jgi:two-component system nitrate/nitrite response regulator NarL
MNQTIITNNKGTAKSFVANTMVKILFIDDDTHTLSLMEQIALILGHQAILCPAAKDAMRIALETLPDLIMLDINMQELNGFDVVKHLRNDGLTVKTPIIILSASEPDFETEKAIAVGADGFIPKPLTIRDLESVVAKFNL